MTLDLDGSTEDVEKLAAYIGVIAWSTLLDALASHSSGLDDLAPDDWRQELLRHTDAVSAAVQAAALPSFRKIARSADQQVKKSPLNQQKLVEPWLKKMSQAGAFAEPRSLEESKKINQVVLAARTKTQEYVGYAMDGLKGQAAEKFTRITSDAALAIKNGKTPREGLAQAAQAWAKEGVPTLRDKAGRHWQPETYLRMVVQNQVKQTTNDVMIQRTKETSGLVKVSSHAACRPTHLQYQGQVYSVNGDITDYPDLYEATNFGSAGGLSGINCQHYVMTYVPGFDTPDYDTAGPESNNIAYALTQQQRKLERDVRAAKREQVAAKEFGSDAEVARTGRLVKMRQDSLRQFVDGHSNTLRRDFSRETGFGYPEREVTAIKKRSTVNLEVFNRHVPNTREYNEHWKGQYAKALRKAEKAGKGSSTVSYYSPSEVIITPTKAQELVNRYGVRDMTTRQTAFLHTSPIGIFIDEKTGERIPTNAGVIVYRKSGAHIRPLDPRKEHDYA